MRLLGPLLSEFLSVCELSQRHSRSGLGVKSTLKPVLLLTSVFACACACACVCVVCVYVCAHMCRTSCCAATGDEFFEKDKICGQDHRITNLPGTLGLTETE